MHVAEGVVIDAAAVTSVDTKSLPITYLVTNTFHPFVRPRAVSWEERIALLWGALCVMIRPTAVFLWIPLGLWRLWHTKHALW